MEMFPTQHKKKITSLVTDRLILLRFEFFPIFCFVWLQLCSDNLHKKVRNAFVWAPLITIHTISIVSWFPLIKRIMQHLPGISCFGHINDHFPLPRIQPKRWLCLFSIQKRQNLCQWCVVNGRLSLSSFFVCHYHYVVAIQVGENREYWILPQQFSYERPKAMAEWPPLNNEDVMEKMKVRTENTGGGDRTTEEDKNKREIGRTLW